MRGYKYFPFIISRILCYNNNESSQDVLILSAALENMSIKLIFFTITERNKDVKIERYSQVF
jgi:hypothetical protein